MAPSVIDRQRTPPLATASVPRPGGPPHTPTPGGAQVLGGVVLAAAALVCGAEAGGALHTFVDRMAGVGALVALSLSVMAGLCSVFRDVLPPRLRTAVQHGHRASGLVGLACLLLHIGVKVAERHVGAGAAALGWGSGNVLIGLGTAAAYLFLLAVLTGLWRGVFASRRWIRPFRVLHGAAYLAWLTAVAHGLTAGRRPAPWVVGSYLLCLALSALALGARLWRARRRRIRSLRAASGGQPHPGAGGVPATGRGSAA